MVKITSGYLFVFILSGSLGERQPFINITAPTEILYKKDDLSLSCLPTEEAASVSIVTISLWKNGSSGWTELIKAFTDSSTGNVTQQIAWYWNGYENRVHNIYAKTFPSNESGLQIDINYTNIICADQGSYLCSLEGLTDIGNSVYSVSSTVYVIVKGTLTNKPVINVDGDLSVGFMVRLNCTYVEEANCTYTVKWYVNQTLLTGSSRYTIQGSLLMFNVEKSDKYHRYACEIGDDSGNSMKSDELSLQPKYPASAKISHTYTCNKSGTATIICEADGNPPNYVFGDWEHVVGGTEIRKLRGNNVGSRSSLKITRCNYQDTGLYYCTVGNGISYPNYTSISRQHTSFIVNDIPIVSGHSVVNFTNGFDIMVSYYSQPQSTEQRLYLNNILLAADKTIFNDVSMPLLYHRIIAGVSGHVMIISVKNTGIYRYTIQNSYGRTEGTIDVWSSTSDVSATQAPAMSESADCSFASLAFGVQVVIIVVIGIVVCIVVLAIAMVIVYRCGKKGDKGNVKEKNIQGNRRLSRVKSIEADGTVVYDEIADPIVNKGKKSKDKPRFNNDKYEDVSPKNHSQGYDTLMANKTRKSKPVFSKKSCKKSKRMEDLVSTSITQDNLYTTDASSMKKEDENMTRKKIPAIQHSDSHETYSDAISSRPGAYVMMKPMGTSKTDKTSTKDTDEYMNLKI